MKKLPFQFQVNAYLKNVVIAKQKLIYVLWILFIKHEVASTFTSSQPMTSKFSVS